MSRFKSVLNLPFGDWMVIEEIETGSTRRVKCRCRCGREDMVYVSHLRSGHSTGCRVCSNFESAIGETFNYLTVTSEPEKGLGSGIHRRVMCSCICGKEDILIRLGHLRSGETKSCGCMKLYDGREFGLIYYLFDPTWIKIFYVGQTVRKPRERLSSHISDGNHNKKKRDWIVSLYPYKPKIIVVEDNIPIAKLNERENFHIEQCLRRKQPLLNIRLPSKISA